MQRAVPVFIGFDDREAEAARVCESSLLRHASIPVLPIFLKESVLRSIGLYGRDWTVKGGVKCDTIDGKPFSTDFAFTRFLVPSLTLRQGWALFMDCDMLWRGDIAELMALADPSCAVMCVKHEYVPAERVKMDGQRQEPYPRKNWSSVMLFNCEHPANVNLTVNAVNLESGRWLHSFGWLRDEQIGALPEEWNYLVGWSRREIDPKIVHYTLGGPWFDEYRNVEYGPEWLEEAARLP